MDIVKSALDGISLDSIFGPLAMVFIAIHVFWHLDIRCSSSTMRIIMNKAEDTAKAILPVTYLSLGGYMLGLILGASRS